MNPLNSQAKRIVCFTHQFKANSGTFDNFFKSIADSFVATANDLKEKNPELADIQVNSANC